MFGIEAWELAVILLIALLVFGPDKLPRMIGDAGRVLRQVRRMATDARSEVSRELGPEFRDIGLDDLNPRSFVRKHLLEGDEDELVGLGEDPPARTRGGRSPRPGKAATARGRANGASRSGATRSTGATRGSEASVPAPFDPDAT